MELLDAGAIHYVWQKNPNYIRKTPKSINIFTHYEVAKTSSRILTDILGDNIPNTRIVSMGESYIILQKKIEGKILRDIPVNDLSIETLEVLEQILKKIGDALKQGIDIDYYGYQGETISGCDMNSTTSKLSLCLRIIAIQKNLFNSSNIMVDTLGIPYFIDSVDSDCIHGRRLWIKNNKGVIKFSQIHSLQKILCKILLVGHQTQLTCVTGYKKLKNLVS